MNDSTGVSFWRSLNDEKIIVDRRTAAGRKGSAYLATWFVTAMVRIGPR